MFGTSRPQHFCGCWYAIKASNNWNVERKYLPQVQLSSSTTILATTSRTTLRQTFINDGSTKLEQVQYTFPLYDGVSVVGFTCTIGSKTIVGVVKEKQQARVDYQEAISRGETAGLLEQLPEASDVFTTSIGNVPANEKISVEIIYLGELKHDAETDGSRFTIPTAIAPRYGPMTRDSAQVLSGTLDTKTGISISVDVTLEEGSIVRGLQSSSHPIAVTMGRTSTMDEDSFSNNHASATLTLGTTELDKDFVIVVLAKGADTPRALLETHPTIPNQRALMATLVPKFNIPSISPEIVFVIDRSGSMGGKIDLVVAAMKIFLKSLPVGVKFNICSFGSHHSFLFKKSKTYDQSSLKDALKHLESFAANYGGTEMLAPVKETVKNRFNDLPLEVMLLTDGEIWNQEELFKFVNTTTNARFFTLGIGSGASSALVEGIARAGNGFAQFVGENEKMDKRVVRMLKGALTPHVTDYKLEVVYEPKEAFSTDDDFEIIESEMPVKSQSPAISTPRAKSPEKKTISLFDTNATEQPTNPPAGRYDNLPDIPVPKVLQAPDQIPALFPFNRTTVYLVLSAEASHRVPNSVILRGTSEHGPLELEIPVQDIGAGETIHQLAAKKAVHELEQGRGWITKARSPPDDKLLKSAHEGKWDLIVEREAVRLGVQFQVGGKWCSFVAVEETSADKSGNPPDYSEKELKESIVDQSSTQIRKSTLSSSLVGAAVTTDRRHVSSSRQSQGGNFGLVCHVNAPARTISTSGAGLFGSSLNTTAPSTGGLFGGFGPGPSNQAPSTGSVFGGFGFSTTNRAPSTGGLFGDVSNPSSNSSTSKQGVGLFGSSTANSSSSTGSLFGSSDHRTIFGSTPFHKSSGTFGSGVGNNRPSAPQSGFGLSHGNLKLTQRDLERLNIIEPPDSALLEAYSTEMNQAACMPLPSEDSDMDTDLEASPGTDLARDTSLAEEIQADQSPDTAFRGQNALNLTSNPDKAMRSIALGAAVDMKRRAHPKPAGADSTLSRSNMAATQQRSRMAPSAAAPSAAPSTGGSNQTLQDYQMGLMMLEQQNKNRLYMSRSAAPGSAAPAPSFGAAAPPPPPAQAVPSPMVNMDFDSFARTPSETAAPARKGFGASAFSAFSEKKTKFFGGGGSKAKKGSPPSAERGGSPNYSPSSDAAEFDEETSDPAVEAALSAPSDKMHALIGLQSFDGSWSSASSKPFYRLIGIDGSSGSVSALSTDGDVNMTALAIAWLKKHVPAEEDVWEMVVEKALGWLEAKVGKDEAAKILKAAENVV
ncbi:hypothetical protein LTR84_002275 [Exophiala bonariae]|uniref:Uncharacterized protein n=1 Tax=Exophiala bonariae TaxID=1690606 RepID=A0AAV9NC35_9EURO|nr:hypothetical protein LTR84_002275 [Exophiala bonariae]